MTVQLHAKQIAPGLMNTMGRNEFDLDRRELWKETK